MTNNQEKIMEAIKNLQKRVEEYNEMTHHVDDVYLDYYPPKDVHEKLIGEGLEEGDDFAVMQWELSDSGRKGIIDYTNWLILHRDEKDEVDDSLFEIDADVAELFYEYENELVLVISPCDDILNFNNETSCTYSRGEIVDTYDSIIIET